MPLIGGACTLPHRDAIAATADAYVSKHMHFRGYVSHVGLASRQGCGVALARTIPPGWLFAFTRAAFRAKLEPLRGTE